MTAPVAALPAVGTRINGGFTDLPVGTVLRRTNGSGECIVKVEPYRWGEDWASLEYRDDPEHGDWHSTSAAMTDEYEVVSYPEAPQAALPGVGSEIATGFPDLPLGTRLRTPQGREVVKVPRFSKNGNNDIDWTVVGHEAAPNHADWHGCSERMTRTYTVVSYPGQDDQPDLPADQDWMVVGHLLSREQIDQLPVGSVIRSGSEVVFTRREQDWFSADVLFRGRFAENWNTIVTLPDNAQPIPVAAPVFAGDLEEMKQQIKAAIAALLTDYPQWAAVAQTAQMELGIIDPPVAHGLVVGEVYTNHRNFPDGTLSHYRPNDAALYLTPRYRIVAVTTGGVTTVVWTDFPRGVTVGGGCGRWRMVVDWLPEAVVVDHPNYTGPLHLLSALWDKVDVLYQQNDWCPAVTRTLEQAGLGRPSVGLLELERVGGVIEVPLVRQLAVGDRHEWDDDDGAAFNALPLSSMIRGNGNQLDYMRTPTGWLDVRNQEPGRMGGSYTVRYIPGQAEPF